MSKFTVYILLIVAVLIGGAQEMMRLNNTSPKGVGEVTQKPSLPAVAGLQSGSTMVVRDNPPIADSESSKIDVAQVATPAVEPATPVQETPKSDPPHESVDDGKAQADFSKVAEGAKSSEPKQAEPSNTNTVAKAATESPEKSKIENTSQPATTLKPIVDLRDENRENESWSATVLKKYSYEDQAAIFEGLPNRTTVNKVVTDEAVKQTVYQNPPESEAEKLRRREGERALAEQRLEAQFLFRQNQMNPTQRIKGDFEAKIVDVLKTTSDRAQRLRNVRAYWNLVIAMIDYHWAYTEVLQLSPADSTRAQSDTLQIRLLQAACDASKARFLETRAAMISAQYELQSVAQLRELPIAIDAPLVQTYITQLAVYYRNQTPPSRLLAIDRTLEFRLDTIVSRASAERGAYESFMMAMDYYKAKTQGFDSQYVVIAYEQLTKHRRALLTSVRDYNFEIDEYVITLVGDRSAADVAKAIIRKDPNAKFTFDDDAPRLAPEQQFNVNHDPGVQQATFKSAAAEDGYVGWGPRPANEMQSVMKKDE